MTARGARNGAWNEDWKDECVLDSTPGWIAERFGQEDFETLAKPDGILAWLDLETRVARASREEFWDGVELPDDPGMTDAERNMHRIMQSTGRAAREFVEEAVRRHEDPDNPIEIDPAQNGRWNDRNIGNWRDENILGLQHFAVREARAGHVERFGFAVITGSAIEKIREAVGDTPIVEIGAGNGWLARELNQRGMTVYPTDPAAIGSNRYALGEREHLPVERLDGFTALAEHPDCDLLWSWPEMEGYVGDVLREFKGRRLIYIGEPGYGCTGPREDLVVTMEGRYRESVRHSIPSFAGVNDNIQILERIDHRLEPAGRDPGEYSPAWAGHIGLAELDQAVTGAEDADLARRIAEAALDEHRIPRETDESLEANLRRNLEFSIPHIARAMVSDAMRYAGQELREELETGLLENATSEDEWAQMRVEKLTQLAGTMTGKMI